MPKKPIEFERREPGGCIICTSHKPNSDGYLRVRLDGKLTMYHRFIWENAIGPIPEGYEVHHLCLNRGCVNLRHLRVLPIKEHKALTNTERSLARKMDAERHWRQTKCTGTTLAIVFNVGVSTACRWVRQWVAQEDTPTTKRKELAVQLREAAVSNCSFPQDSPLGKPFHVEVHSHRGCGNCYWWDCEDHDCTRPGICDHLDGWRSREDNT